MTYRDQLAALALEDDAPPLPEDLDRAIKMRENWSAHGIGGFYAPVSEISDYLSQYGDEDWTKEYTSILQKHGFEPDSDDEAMLYDRFGENPG